MEYVRQPGDGFFEVGAFTQRVVELEGTHREANEELLYVLEGTASVQIGGEEHAVAAGCALLVPPGTEWTASGDARAVSVLVPDAEPAAAPAVVDLAEVEKGSATAGRQFVLGPECASATQFIGLIPPGRAPDHYHEYDEVIYVLEGQGELEIDGRTAPLGPGTCVHLPRTLVHCLANTGENEMRVLGVFRPAGSPAEAYYPDGTLAVVPDTKE